MKADTMKFLDFIGDSKKVFEIPVYQRNYNWNKEQCTELFEDIEKIVLNNFEIEHFIGTIVYVLPSEKNNIDIKYISIIDGQQRITTLTLLLKAIYDNIFDDYEKNNIYKNYLINEEREKNIVRIKLKEIESDNGAYKKLLSNIEPLLEDSCVTQNYKIFCKLLLNSKYNVEDIYKAIKYIQIVYIQLEENNENPQIIFENLNGTGLSLTDGDLIRNFLLMGLSVKKQTEFYNNFWLEIENEIINDNIPDFIKNYLIMKTGNTSPNIYSSFKKYTNMLITQKHSKENLLKDLKLHSKFYSYFINANTEDDDINSYLIQIKMLKQTTIYPLLLKVFENYFVSKKIGKNDIVNIFKLLISYSYRRIICNYHTNYLRSTFASICSKLNENDESLAYNLILETLMDKSMNSKFPRNKEFELKFIDYQIYGNKNIAKYTLEQINFKGNTKEKVNLGDIQIEHIMPQTLTSNWSSYLNCYDKDYKNNHLEYLHTIGNLTLTGYNPEISNKDFDDKKEIYKKSNINITRDICSYEIWNKYEILNRAKKLFETAKEIWKIDDSYEGEIEKPGINSTTEYSILDDIDVTGLKPSKIIIKDNSYELSAWNKFFEIVCKNLYEMDREKFFSFTKDSDFKKKGKGRIISNNINDIIKSYKVSNDIFIETNLSSNAILGYIKIIIQHYNLQEEIFFYIK